VKQQREFQPVAREGVTAWPAGDEPTAWVPGDFILTHNTRLLSKLIRFGQRLRIHGDDRVFAHWSHSALVISEAGDLIDVDRRGVFRTHIREYRDIEYKVVHTGASADDRRQAVDFAEWAAEQHHRIGALLFASIALNLLTGGKVSFFVDGTTVCSGLIARAQERCGAIFHRSPTHIMPADLAKYYDVRP